MGWTLIQQYPQAASAPPPRYEGYVPEFTSLECWDGTLKLGSKVELNMKLFGQIQHQDVYHIVMHVLMLEFDFYGLSWCVFHIETCSNRTGTRTVQSCSTRKLGFLLSHAPSAISRSKDSIKLWMFEDLRHPGDLTSKITMLSTDQWVLMAHWWLVVFNSWRFPSNHCV